MEPTVILDWTYAPDTCFEDPIHWQRDGYSIAIDSGKITATIPAARFDAAPELRDQLEREMMARVRAAQTMNHTAVDLRRSGSTRVGTDGKRTVCVEIGEVVTARSALGALDFTVTDSSGRVTTDSRADRIERRKALCDMAAAAIDDELLSAMLESYSDAIADPDNELVYLYEIREAVNAHFMGKKAATEALSLLACDWTVFGQLCCDAPLRQGRHRGKHFGALRDATEGELREARKFAQTIIERYLKHCAGIRAKRLTKL